MAQPSRTVKPIYESLWKSYILVREKRGNHVANFKLCPRTLCSLSQLRVNFQNYIHFLSIKDSYYSSIYQYSMYTFIIKIALISMITKSASCVFLLSSSLRMEHERQRLLWKHEEASIFSNFFETYATYREKVAFD